MRYVHIIKSIVNRIVAIYEVNADTELRKRALLLEKMSRISEMTLIGGSIVYTIGGVLHIINPIYGYYWQHKFKPLIPLYVPFVDETAADGFAILLTIQTIEIIVATMASICADFPFMIVIMNVWIFSTIFEDNVNELNEIFRAKKVDMPLAKTKLKGIFEMYYDNWT